MEVMIVVPLVVPDAPVGVGVLEPLVAAWGRQGMRQAMAAAWAAQATQRPRPLCPACGGEASHPAGTKGGLWVNSDPGGTQGAGELHLASPVTATPAAGGFFQRPGALWEPEV